MSAAGADAVWRDAANWALVPWVGAGVPRGLRHVNTGRPLVPGWRAFLETTANDLDAAVREPALAAIRDDDLESAASELHNAMEGAAWRQLLRRTFEVQEDDADVAGVGVLEQIWKVSRGLVITTNYDNSLMWRRATGGATPTIYDLRSMADLSTMLSATSKHPVLWHLHGSITHPDSIILEKSEYERLYDPAPRPPAHPDSRERSLNAAYACLHAIVASQSLLFVGSSLTDPRVNQVLRSSRELFPEPRTHHFIVELERDAAALRARLDSEGLDHITVLPVRSYGDDELSERLRTLRPVTGGSLSLRVMDDKWIRRRCRTVVAGGGDFIEKIRVLLGENQPQEAASRLGDMLLDHRELTTFQKALMGAQRHEFRGEFEEMRDGIDSALAQTDLEPVERLNLLLFRAIALEKLSRALLPEAIGILELILDDPASPAELALCAEFNREVCREKLEDGTPSFERFISRRDYRFVTNELLWTKAWGMELVRCGRAGLEFRYEDQFRDVVAAEQGEASTGSAKSIVNMYHYTGTELPDDMLTQLMDVADSSPITQRIPYQLFVVRRTSDPKLRAAILDSLVPYMNDPDHPDLARLFQTRTFHGRYTLFGEFLMHTKSWGYVAPVPMSLSGTMGIPERSSTWDKDADHVRTFVKQMGIQPIQSVQGDLPFGQGFATSTILALIHVNDWLDAPDRQRVVHMLDWINHGFEPSGMDYAAITKQRAGFYRNLNWEDAEPLPIDGVFVRAEGETSMTLRQAQRRILNIEQTLASLAFRLKEGIDASNGLDVEAFAAYCDALRDAGVYTDQQIGVIDAANAAGLQAKGIGGLHGKAILALGDADKVQAFVDSLPAESVLGRLHST